MHNATRYILLTRLVEQCDFALVAATTLVRMLRHWQPQSKEDMSRRHLLIWFNVQNFVVAVGNIAKVLSPVALRFKKGMPRHEVERRNMEMQHRAESLRAELGIAQDNIILQKKVRNGFEHYDEHVHALDLWGKAPHPDIVDKVILPPGSIQISGKRPSYLRAINPQTLTISFQDVPMPGSIPDYIRELTSLREAANRLHVAMARPSAEGHPRSVPAPQPGSSDPLPDPNNAV